jgi:hypothetical protein
MPRTRPPHPPEAGEERSSNLPGTGERPKNWPKSSSRPRRQSQVGRSKLIGMREPASMGRLSEREEIRWLRKKPRQPQQEQDILAKATAQSQEGDRRRPAQIFRFIDLCQAEFPIGAMRERSGSVQERLLQVAEPTSLQAAWTGRDADHENQGNTWADREIPTGPVGHARSFGPRASASAKSASMA